MYKSEPFFPYDNRTPDDVELWTAGLSEVPEDPDIAVGPLFAKMIARQFRELKRGDRFFYETNDPRLRFTPSKRFNSDE